MLDLESPIPGGAGKAVAKLIGAAQNDGELVVEIVRQPGRQIGDGLHPLRLHHTPLQVPPAADIAQHQDRAQALIRAVLKTGDLDDGGVPRAGNQRVGPMRAAGRAGWVHLQQFDDGVFRGRSGGFLMQRKHFHEQASMRVGRGPAREPLGHRVHEDHFAVRVGGHHTLADAAQSGCQPRFAGAQAAFHLVLVDGNLHGAAQFGVPYGFQNVTEWLRAGGPVDGFLVRMGGDVDHRHFQLGFHGLGGGDAVHVALQTDVHEDEIERRRPGKVERLFAGARDGWHLIAQPLQPALDVRGDNAFIFNDQDLLVWFRGKLHGFRQPSNFSVRKGTSLSCSFWGTSKFPRRRPKCQIRGAVPLDCGRRPRRPAAVVESFDSPDERGGPREPARGRKLRKLLKLEGGQGLHQPAPLNPRWPSIGLY